MLDVLLTVAIEIELRVMRMKTSSVTPTLRRAYPPNVLYLGHNTSFLPDVSLKHKSEDRYTTGSLMNGIESETATLTNPPLNDD